MGVEQHSDDATGHDSADFVDGSAGDGRLVVRRFQD
jgi:hypothetical protein